MQKAPPLAKGCRKTGRATKHGIPATPSTTPLIASPRLVSTTAIFSSNVMIASRGETAIAVLKHAAAESSRSA